MNRPLTDEEEARLRQADAWETLDPPCTDCDGEGYHYERTAHNEVAMTRCEACNPPLDYAAIEAEVEARIAAARLGD